MTQKSDNAILYVAVYDNPDSAHADLDALEKLRTADLIGSYDAAVIDQEDGRPHIVKRADHPGYRVIPEWLGAGTLPRRELHEAAQELQEGQAALIVVGEPTLAQGLEKAITKANRAVKRELTTAADELERELLGAVRS
jgi:uncharacterized membrane protein